MRSWLVLVVLIAGCYDDPVRHCPAVDCPSNMVCDNQNGCALKEQLEQCAGQPDGTACTYPGVTNGECKDELCLPSGCGNGIQTSTEICDDGNTTNGDGCSADCRSLETCGNSIVDPAAGEQCDGTPNCRADCTERRCGDGIMDAPFESCDDGEANSDSTPDACRLNCQVPRCGDGVLDSNEACDDSGTESGDGCSANCLVEACGNGIIEAQEECDDGANNANAPNKCRLNCKRARCGDEIVDAPFESCDAGDDDNANAPDSCRTNCQLPRCGDNIIDATEVCDFGDAVAGGNCSADCTSDETCGNNTVDPGEQCDTGNANANAADKCRLDCTLPRCGDGVKDALEACDNGTSNSDTGPNACRTNCQLPRCGDGVEDTGEVCDQLNNNVSGDGCSADCKSKEECGDGILNVEKGETCDCGTTNATAPASCGGLANSNTNSNAPCRANCQLRRCNDGTLEQPEQCEGQNLGGKQCSDLGFYDGDLKCSQFCTFDTDDCVGTCGDGVLDSPQEQCDGAKLGGATCQTFGFQQGVLACNAGCGFDTSGCSLRCGDNDKTGAEQCDGADFGDAPNVATCTTVGFYGGQIKCNTSCGFDTSSCIGKCGDSDKNGPEQCDGSDFGDAPNIATCASAGFYGGTLKCNPICGFDTSSCIGKCGDGTRQAPQEQCDGNTPPGLNFKQCQDFGFQTGTLKCNANCGFDTSGCSGSCGDGTINGQETCDTNEFGGQSCQSLGFYTGELSCTFACTVFAGGCDEFCGDGEKNGPEPCDKLDFGTDTCTSLGEGVFVGGAGPLICDPKCEKVILERCPRVEDGKCDVEGGETCFNSTKDCGGDTGFCCGNGICSPAENETTCLVDCQK